MLFRSPTRSARLFPGQLFRAAGPFPANAVPRRFRSQAAFAQQKCRGEADSVRGHAPKKCRRFFGKLHCAPRTRYARTVHSVKSVLSDAPVAGKNRSHFFSPYRRRNSARRCVCVLASLFSIQGLVFSLGGGGLCPSPPIDSNQITAHNSTIRVGPGFQAVPLAAARRSFPRTAFRAIPGCVFSHSTVSARVRFMFRTE